MTCRRTAYIVCLMILLAATAAHTDGVRLEEPVAGFDGMFLPDSWVPLHSRLDSPDTPFRGDITFTIREPGTTRYRIVRRVDMDSAGSLPVELVVPTPAAEFDVDVTIHADGDEPRHTTWSLAAPSRPVRIVLVVGPPGALDLLNRIRGTMADNASLIYVGPEQLPGDPLGYDTIDTVVLYDSHLARLPPETVAALEVWTRRGGRVITVGGSHLSPADGRAIRPLLPGRVGELARGMPRDWDALFPLGIAGDTASVLYSRFDPDERAQTVPRRGIPLIAYEDRGKGSVAFVATRVATLGRVAMPGSGIWREAFPPLSPVGRVRVPTMIRRTARDSLVGETIISDGPRLFPGRAIIAIVGLLYIVFTAVLTRRLARSHLPPRAAVLRPASLALAVSALMLLGATRGTWTTPATIADGELFRGSALRHGSEPTPGIVEKDVIVASRTGGSLEIELPATLQPVPLEGRTVTVRRGPSRTALLSSLDRGEQSYHFLQTTLSLDVTAALAPSSRGVNLSLRNGSSHHLSDAVLLWNGRLFLLGDLERGTTFRSNLAAAGSDRAIRRSLGVERGRMLLRLRESGAGVGPVLITFAEEPLVPMWAAGTHGRRTLTVAMFSLQQPLSTDIRGSR
ncbi:MAG: hypothetical protein ACLFNX_03585 [Spirochaetaceae bacterium]